jgi:hypothetical protein
MSWERYRRKQPQYISRYYLAFNCKYRGKPRNYFSQDNTGPGRDSNIPPPEYRLEALPPGSAYSTYTESVTALYAENILNVIQFVCGEMIPVNHHASKY